MIGLETEMVGVIYLDVNILILLYVLLKVVLNKDLKLYDHIWKVKHTRMQMNGQCIITKG